MHKNEGWLNIIELKQISKSFQVSKRNPGLKKAVKALFKREYEIVQALDNVSFKIKEGDHFYSIRVRMTTRLQNLQYVYIVKNVLADEQNNLESTLKYD